MPLSQRLYFAIEKRVMESMPIRVLKVADMRLMNHCEIINYLRQKLAAYNDDLIRKEASGEKISEEQYILLFAIKQTTFIVLSHTWLERSPEVTFRDTTLTRKGHRMVPDYMKGPGFDKLSKFCRVVRIDFETEFAWADTVCIDKDNYGELQESISSMFKWYANSATCIVYLAETTSFADVHQDRWFTRGWTLQELLAPNMVAFYAQSWKCLDLYAKDELTVSELEQIPITRVINRVAQISPAELHGFAPGFEQGIAPRMVWITKRQTTKPEDMVYSIMGIFSIRMAIDYGEGKERAFFRLLEHILSRPGTFPHSLSLLNWAGGPPIDNKIHPSSIIPSGPESYSRHQKILNNCVHYIPRYPLNLNASHFGVQISLLLVFAKPMRHVGERHQSHSLLFTLDQNPAARVWQDPVPVTLSDINTTEGRAVASNSNCYIFGIWTFMVDGDVIKIPRVCSAFLFGITVPPDAGLSAIKCPDEKISARSRIHTQEVILMGTVSRHEEVRFSKSRLDTNYNIRYLENHFI